MALCPCFLVNTVLGFSTVVQWVKLPRVMLAFLTGVCLAVPLLIQVPTNVPETAEEDGPGGWPLLPTRGDLEGIPGCWPQHGPAWGAVAFLGNEAAAGEYLPVSPFK